MKEYEDVHMADFATHKSKRLHSNELMHIANISHNRKNRRWSTFFELVYFLA